jgi:hypothetical protein
MMGEKLRAAAKAVLKNTKNLHVCCSDFNHSKKDLHRDDNCPPWRRYNEALAELEAALAEPAIKESLTVAEPIACVGTNGDLMWLKKPEVVYSKPQPLYTAPPRREWVGLTDEEIDKAWEWAQRSSPIGVTRLTVFARAVERAHGIGVKDEHNIPNI